MPQLQRHHGTLLLICGLALALRLFLLPMLHNPGLHDALHYYNLGARLGGEVRAPLARALELTTKFFARELL